MIVDFITIKPINPDEWLPDRCLTGSEPFDPECHLPQAGCPGINYSLQNDRKTLEQLYRSAIKEYGGCGFVAWDNNKVIAYHNFFPSEIARKIKFYGYGIGLYNPDRVLIHNCLSIVRVRDYLRQGICSRLVETSIGWAKNNGWKRFEVYSVLPDSEIGWQSDQKSCLTFWKRLGFEVLNEYDADKMSKEYYGTTKRYSMYLSF